MKLNEKGFVLIEFVIALPLIILLLYGLNQTTMKIFDVSETHAADYELEVEAQEILAKIVEEARTASYVKRKDCFGNMEIDTLLMNYHTIDYNPKEDDLRIIDVIDKRVYIVSNDFKLNAKRQNDNTFLNPITSNNSVIKRLQYTRPADKVLHITLEMESLLTSQRINLSTAVYMPACDVMEGF